MIPVIKAGLCLADAVFHRPSDTFICGDNSVGLHSALMHLSELVFQYPDRKSASTGQNECKNGHPNRGSSSKPSRPVSGGFLLFLGFALLKLAFYIADEPSPPRIVRLCYLIVGGLAFICVCQGLNLAFGLL